MKLKTIILSFCLVMAATAMAQPLVVAHRGYWRTAGSAQNSIAALCKADSIGCHASELDVWLTTDGRLYVNHDGTFKGVKIQDADSETVGAIVLNNGEKMPTLEEYLATARGLNTRLVVELKGHATETQESEAVRKIVKAVKKYKLSDRVDYISFSFFACMEFLKVAPKGTPVYYLNGELTPMHLKVLGFAGLDYSYNTIQKHPEWIKQAHELGLKVNIWTVDAEDKMQWLIDNDVDFITTNEPELLQMLISKQK